MTEPHFVELNERGLKGSVEAAKSMTQAGGLRVALRRGAYFHSLLASAAPSEFLRECIDQAVARLRRRPGALWDNLLSLRVDKRIKQVFDRARGERANLFALPTAVMFPSQMYPMQFILDEERGISVTVDDAEMLQTLRKTISGEWSDSPASDPAHEFALALRDEEILTTSGSTTACDQPGIYRLQHASLLYRSESGTGIITDPVFGLSGVDWVSPQTIPNIDAILVSHSHTDHFCPLSLMHFPRETTIIVPKVFRSTMLCPDMGAILRDSGFENVIAAPWYSTVRVKDIDVHVYPFYGEQPWLSFSAPVADLRNHGNTYAVMMDGCKTWFLVDSGIEFGHSMIDLCETVLNDLGSMDIVVSNLRSFGWHPKQIDRSGRYLFCFSAEALDEPDTWPTGLMTFDPTSMHGFLSALKPRWLLPYAHWWHAHEQTSHVVDGMASEKELLKRIGDVGTSTGTELTPWQVGDRLEWKHSQIRVRPGL